MRRVKLAVALAAGLSVGSPLLGGDGSAGDKIRFLAAGLSVGSPLLAVVPRNRRQVVELAAGLSVGSPLLGGVAGRRRAVSLSQPACRSAARCWPPELKGRSELLPLAAGLSVGSPLLAQPPGGFGGTGGGGGFGGFAPTPPGKILSTNVQNTLKLSDEQKKQLEDLQKELDGKLEKILTDEQKKQLQELKDRPASGFGQPGGGRPRQKKDQP